MKTILTHKTKTLMGIASIKALTATDIINQADANYGNVAKVRSLLSDIGQYVEEIAAYRERGIQPDETDDKEGFDTYNQVVTAYDEACQVAKVNPHNRLNANELILWVEEFTARLS